MPRVDSTPLAQDQTLLANIQSEVATESRPLFTFIVNNSKYIVAIIVLLIVALLGTAVYRYVQNSRQQETLESIAKIMQHPADAKQIASLEELQKTCPSSMQLPVAVALVQSAVAQENREKAAEGYAKVAAADYDNSLGLASAVSQAGELLFAGKYAEGVKILQGIAPRLPEASGLQVKMMLAEAASRAGQYDLAAKTYDELAASNAVNELDREYAASRAKDLHIMAKNEAGTGK